VLLLFMGATRSCETGGFSLKRVLTLANPRNCHFKLVVARSQHCIELYAHSLVIKIA
jgi:hypothetical protein